MRRILTALLLAATIISSCTKEIEELPTPTPDTPDQNTPVMVRMNLSPENLETTTKAVDESTIFDVNIFLFGNTDYQFYESGTNLSYELLPGEYTLYAVANAGVNMGERSETYLNSYKTTNQTIGQDNRIVMSTKISVSIPSTTSAYTLPDVTLFRSAAKVTYNISVDESVQSSISLQSVTLHSEATWCSVFDVDAAPTANPEDYSDRATVEISDPTQYSETVYLIENLQGVVSSITDQRDKSPENAPENATYLKIYAKASGKIIEYIVYLGENNTSDFNIRRNTQHTMNLVIMGEDEIDNRTTVYDGLYYGTANCIINTGMSVTFDITPYRTSKALSYRYTGIEAGDSYNAYRPGMLWQDTKGLVTGYSISNNKLTVNTSGAEGNAVIALYNVLNQIVWSFHIWCTDQPVDIEYAENALGNTYTVMDRNLGATANSFASHDSYGLFYQWGRKDPFIGAISANPEQTGIMHQNNGELYTFAGAEITFANYCISTPTSSTINTAITNPMNFYYKSSGYANWYDVGTNAVDFDPYLWGNSSVDDVNPPKSVYDPSPAGYKVPEYDHFLVFNKEGRLAAGTTAQLSVDSNYVYFSFVLGWLMQYKREESTALDIVYYPACGIRSPYSYYDGGLSSVGSTGYYWSSTSRTNITGYCSYFNYANFAITASHNHTTGMSIRCVRE